MRKPRLYLETSVWNFLFAADAPEKRAATYQFFKEVEDERYEIFVSNVVQAEILSAPIEKREMLNDAVEKYKPVRLDVDDEVRSLAMTYIQHGVLPEKHLNDLLHLSLATANGLTALISWNLRHLVKMRTFTLANSVNRANGYHEIMIFTPEEALDYGD